MAREGKGWNLRRLGEAAALDFGYVGKIERGESPATTETLALVCGALGITLASLFEGVPMPRIVRPDAARRKSTRRGRNTRPVADSPDISRTSRSRRHPR